MTEDKSLLEMISEVQEFIDIHLYFKDEDIDRALGTIIRIIAKPDIPPNVAAPLVAQTQALSSKFQMMAKYYMLYGSDETKEEKTRKKNTLMSLSAEMEKLSNALKYLVKS